MDANSYLTDYFKELIRTKDQISEEEIKKMTDILFDVWKNDKTVFVIGNGGSASTVTHFACDIAKDTIVKDKKRFKVMSMVDNIPLVSSWTNDNGFETIFDEQLQPWLSEGDCIVFFTVHGASGSGEAGLWSQNIPRAIFLAKQRKAYVLGFSGFEGGPVADMSDVCITVSLTEEPLASPIIESWHCIIYHLITIMLKIKISNEL